jgi:(R,R)-butanediol dehydrogenase / meso-butanediol dehydrogenase / diacetyl reductase
MNDVTGGSRSEAAASTADRVTSMLAAVLHGPRDLRVEDIAERPPGAREVTIDVACNGLCGSDLKLYESGLRSVDKPHPVTHHCGPQVLGHELAGVIGAVGPDIIGYKIGDRVCVQPDYPCGICPPCTAGFSHLCQIITFLGVISSGGGLSERLTIDHTKLHHLPDSLSLEQGALVEPMAVAYHAVGRADPQPGEIAVIIGAGPIGIGAVLNLRARGVTDVIVVEPSPQRRAVVQAMGAEAVHPDDAEAFIARRTDRHGADVAFDCAGVGSTFGATLAALRARGRAVVVAGSSSYPLQTTAHLLQHTEITITGSVAFQRAEFAAVIDLMAAGAFPVDGWVEHVPLESVVEEGFAPLLAGRKTKVLIDLPAAHHTRHTPS